MKNRKLAWVITALLVVAAIALGQFKAPVTQSDNFYVTDAADLFSSQEESAIVGACQGLLTTGGARMVVVTVNHTGLRQMSSYAETLWKDWRLSSIDMLLLMKTDDYYLLYGSELSSVMDDNYRTLMDRYLEPCFATGDYSAAVLSFIGAGSALLTMGSAGNGWAGSGNPGGGFGSGMGGILLGVLLFAVILAVCMAFAKARPASKRRYYGGYAPNAGSFMGTMGRAATRSAINTMGKPSAYRSSSRPASFGGSAGSTRRSGGSFGGGSFGGGGRGGGFGGGFGGGGGRGGGSRGGGGRR